MRYCAVREVEALGATRLGGIGVEIGGGGVEVICGAFCRFPEVPAGGRLRVVGTES